MPGALKRQATKDPHAFLAEAKGASKAALWKRKLSSALMLQLGPGLRHAPVSKNTFLRTTRPHSRENV